MSPLVMRASDADRDQVAELLHAAYAEGRISYDEHDDRVAAALAAKTFDQLEDLTVDLVPVAPNRPSVIDVSRPSGEPDRVVSLVSDTKRVGPWRVAPVTQAQAVIGSVLLDLTDATFEAPVVEIQCAVFMGDVKIRVRPGTHVRMEASGIIGDTSVKGIGEPDPTMPTVVVRGTAVIGDISVRGPKRPPFWRR